MTLFAGWASVAPSSAQDLADVAKQEESRRQNVKQETKDAGRNSPKVFTNKDLRGGSASSTAETNKPSGAPAAQSGAPKAAASGAAANEPAADGKAADGKTADGKVAAKGEVKDEAYWRKRAQVLRDQLERDRTLAEALQSRVGALTADFSSRDDPAQRAKIGADRQKALVELDRMKAAVSAGTKAIADLDEEARRAGVPPGWLR